MVRKMQKIDLETWSKDHSVFVSLVSANFIADEARAAEARLL
jgi:hypothetical protein